MKSKQNPYQKPKIKSSKIKTISFYNRGSIKSPDEIEFLLAATVT